MISLTAWHRALHEVTGDMALRWCRATPSDLVDWARELHAIAQAMEASAAGGQPTQSASEGAQQSDHIPDWLLEVIDT